MEAMSCGMEVVGAHHSGMLDYLGDEWAWPVRTAAITPADGPGEEFAADFVAAYGPAGNYWLIDEEHGARQLRAAHRAWKRGTGKGSKAARYIRAHHTVGDQARSILSVVEQYL
jgi:glycosyltransferase involved in cell wall biosynthesis